MSIGIGGAGSKVSSLLDNGNGTIVNVSEVELSKVPARNKILAVTHSNSGQFKGAGRNPDIGKTAFVSIKDELFSKIQGEIVFSSTGGGTGNGITSVLLESIANSDVISENDRTVFALILPYVNLESSEYVENTIDFLLNPVSSAIDSGNTGNIILFSNRIKFEGRITESDYNYMITRSLQSFLDIPAKGAIYESVDGHIDQEDFNVFKSKPYFNHFTQFFYDLKRSFGEQLRDNYNKLLLDPEQTIEAMLLLELPNRNDAGILYDILDFFAEDEVTPHYGVVLNPELEQPKITVSLLYSRKPQELVKDFKEKADKLARTKVKKSIEQFVKLEAKPFDLTKEINKMTSPKISKDGELAPADVKPAIPEDDILSVLKRLKKLK